MPTQDSLVLDVDDACHILTVETGGPIFSVALQSAVLLDLEETPLAVLSHTPPDPANGSLTLATYRSCSHHISLLDLITAELRQYHMLLCSGQAALQA